MLDAVFADFLINVTAIVVAHYLLKWMERIGKRKWQSILIRVSFCGVLQGLTNQNKAKKKTAGNHSDSLFPYA